MSESITDDYDDYDYDDEEDVPMKTIEYIVKFEYKCYVTVPKSYPSSKVAKCKDVMFDLLQPEAAEFVSFTSKPHVGDVPKGFDHTDYTAEELDTDPSGL